MREANHGGGVTTVVFTDLPEGLRKTQIEQLAALGVFDPLSGTFEPDRPVTRGELVRWLFRANNGIWGNEPDKQIQPASGGRTTFPDVPSSHPDYKDIQGFEDAGSRLDSKISSFIRTNR